MKNITQRSPAFLLHKRRYRESSFLVTLLTERFSLINAVYPGARKKGRSAIDLHTSCLVSWRGTGSLVTIQQCEPLEQFTLTGKRLFSAMYVHELLVKTLPEGAIVEGVFHAYQQLLYQLADSSTDTHACLRNFERELLRGLGLEFVFDTQRNGEPIHPDESYCFEDAEGFVQVQSLEEPCIKGSTLLAIHRNDYSESETRRTAKMLLQSAFSRYIGYEKLKAGDLFGDAFLS
ncbi:MAG: DNA repair protein RecO [Gammaproteobacteria bacterium]|nr:DNA repair protein RecO [Gammaproteobacteria bacterium]